MTGFRVGCAPITWNNEDLRAELGPPVPFASLLDQVRGADYVGTELGDGFPRDAAALREGLLAHGVGMPSGWGGLPLLASDADFEADLPRVKSLCELLAAAGATFVNLAHQGTPETLAMAGRRAESRRLPAAEWDRLAERVDRAADIARSVGLQPLFHVHAGTAVESYDDMQELLRRIPADRLQLCWDVGHALYGGIDPVAVVREYPERIAYLHLKDLDMTVLETLRRERLGFLEGVRRRVFTELGQGCLDVPGLLAALRDIGYDGWLMVEQDSTWLTPADSVRKSREYLRSLGV